MNRAPKPKSNNTTMYIIIAIVVLCCCCCCISSLTGGLASLGIGESPSPAKQEASKEASKEAPKEDAKKSSQTSGGNNCVERENNDKCPNEIKSSNGKYKIIMQEDGNLVLYKDNKTPLWSSETKDKGKKPYRHIVQKDGNYVVYDADNKATWASGSQNKGKGPYKLIVQDDGNVVLYKENAPKQTGEYAIWSTKTFGK